MLHIDNEKEIVNEPLTKMAWKKEYQTYIERKISSTKSRSSWKF